MPSDYLSTITRLIGKILKHKMISNTLLRSKVLQKMTSKTAPMSRLLSSEPPVGKLSGKVAIVTASTDGIGLGIAENLARHGASVMVSSRKVGREGGC